jgi:flagellin
MANIGATTAFYKVETSLTRANSEVSKSMERLATGRQNANAGDRASYVAMADTFRLDFVGTKAGIKGASVTMGYLETGMRVLDSASALLSRLQELAVLGANDTNTTADHEAINLEAEAIGDEFNRLMTTSTYKGRDVFNETAGSLYVAMGGRDQEMTFGIGTIDYSDMYVAEERTIAGAVVTTPKAFGFTPTGSTLIDESGNLEAGKQYIVTVAPTTGNEADYDNGNNMLAEKVFADTSHIFRGGNSDDVAIADDAGNMLAGDVLVVTTAMPTADFNGETVVRFREVLTGTNAFVAGESYTISSLGGSNGEVDMDNFALTQTANHSLDAGAIGRAVTGIVDGDTLAVGQTFTVDVDASTAEMAGLNALTQGMTFVKVSDTLNDIDGPNKDATFNLAHLPSDAVVARGMGAASEVGRSGASGLEADKTYIVRTRTSDERDYAGGGNTKAGDILAAASAVYSQNGGSTAKTTGNMAEGDVIVLSSAVAGTLLDSTMSVDEVNTSSTAFLAGQEYEIVSMGDSDGVVDISSFTSDAAAISRASSDIADGATLVQGTKFTVDADASVTELAYLNALRDGMTFRMSSDTLTKDIEAMQGLLNTARVQAGSQYAALESAVNYTTDLTAQYELGYNTVNDVNFSMETAHLAKNQILQQAATAMLAQANSGQQGLLQLIS